MARKILLIDDDQDLREMVAEALQEDGFDVTQAKNGERGIERLNDSDPDLIIVDLMMPKMDGFEFLSSVKSRNLKSPIVVFSGYIESETETIILEMGASAFVKKPLVYDELIGVIEKLTKEANS